MPYAAMLVFLTFFGLVAVHADVHLCDLMSEIGTTTIDLPDDILALNKIRFTGFEPKVSRAISTTGKAYMEITGYSAAPNVEKGDHLTISPNVCTDEASGSSGLSPSWFPFACAAMVAILPSGNRMAAVVPALALAQGAAAAGESCTHTIEVTIHLPGDPQLVVERPNCSSKIAKNTTSDRVVGGTLYVYKTTGTGTKAWKTIQGKSYVDLANESIKSHCVPKHKPHMVHPSPDNKYTVITYTSDQDYHVIKNSDYSVVQCPSVEAIKPHVFGGAVHAGAWHTRAHFLAVDMTGCVDGTCGGAIHRHDYTYAGQGVLTKVDYYSSLSHKDVAAARGTAATKPIAIGNNPSGAYKHLFFVTDAKGAGSIMNANTMEWDTHFNISDFGNCTGGGLWVEPHPSDEKIVLAQYGSQAGASCIFKVNMMAKTLELLAQLSDNADAHGMQFCKTTGNAYKVLNTNRRTATLDVIDYASGSFDVHDYDMNSQAFDAVNGTYQKAQTDKLQPDVAYLHQDYLYMAARGPIPVSVVKEQNYYANAHPGMMALKIDLATCGPAADQSTAFVLSALERSPEITSDVHSLWGVRNGNDMEIWTVDQAGTGSVQQYDVYSGCAAYGVNPNEIHADKSPHTGD